MITEISNTLLRVDEEVGYYAEMASLMEKYKSKELQLEKFISGLSSVVNEAQNAIHQARGSNHTATANELEKVRNQSFMAFRDVVKAGTHRVDENWANNARKIERIIRSHGWSFYSKGTKVQTAIMESLKAELDKEENQLLINEIALSDWYAEMNETNKNYLNVINKRFNEEAQKEKYDTGEIYKSMRLAGDDLCQAIEVLYKMSGNQLYNEIANAINALTEKYMATARGRKTRNENEKLTLSEKE